MPLKPIDYFPTLRVFFEPSPANEGGFLSVGPEDPNVPLVSDLVPDVRDEDGPELVDWSERQHQFAWLFAAAPGLYKLLREIQNAGLRSEDALRELVTSAVFRQQLDEVIDLAEGRE